MVNVFSSLRAASAAVPAGLGRDGLLFSGAGFGGGAAQYPVRRDCRVRPWWSMHERLKLRRRPLVIVLHPTGGVGARAHRHVGLEEIAESSRPVFLYPDALGGEWPAAPGPDADRDVKFLRDLVDRFINDGSIDPRKIYLIGEASAASSPIGRLAPELDVRWPVSRRSLPPCRPTSPIAPPAPIAYIAISHVGDPRIPFAGGPAKINEAAFDALPAETALAVFAKNASCSAKREERPLADAIPQARRARRAA